jgi:23S rRNA (cytidine1920-2'-O)/16S rRNA (cytidine1409-2'-O)-methyltransferase
VGAGRRRAAKPGEIVEEDEPLSVDQRPPYVSRGGIKLANALASSGLQVGGRRALDVGAATGGFSDCLLQHGARGVIALDVGYGALALSLRRDPRVHVLERTNVRSLTPAALPYAPEVAVIDVSFISLAKVLGPVIACLTERFDVLALIKPQFELGPGRVGKGGVVRDAAARREALLDVGHAALALGTSVLGYHSSGLPGPKGNRETFLWLAETGRRVELAPAEERAGGAASAGRDGADATEGLERIAREVEP